jgi:hypothetical protein
LGPCKGENALAKRRKEGAKKVTARNKVGIYRHKEKQNNLTWVKKSMDTTYMLELTKLYRSMGGTAKAKEIILSANSEMMKPADEVKLFSSSIHPLKQNLKQKKWR